MMKAYRTGSGYYIDVGCSQLIIDGEIKMKSGVAIERLTERGLPFRGRDRDRRGYCHPGDRLPVLCTRPLLRSFRGTSATASEGVGGWVRARATTPVHGTASHATCTNLWRMRISGFKGAISRSRGSSPSLWPCRSKRVWRELRRPSMGSPFVNPLQFELVQFHELRLSGSTAVEERRNAHVITRTVVSISRLGVTGSGRWLAARK